MDNGITVIFSTKGDDDRKRVALIENVSNTCGCECHLLCIANPDGVALTKVYNDMMKSKNVHDDIVVFVHDDIEFLKRGWGPELLKIFDKHKDYGIVGIAGSAQFDEMGAWWNYEKKYGQVLHRNEGKSWLTAFSPLLKKDIEEVCVVDGLFIAVHRQRIKEKFDENVSGFDFYDITFCLDNYLKGVKIGVTTNIRIAHNSVGKLKESWYKNREYANKKYKDFYPINVK